MNELLETIRAEETRKLLQSLNKMISSNKVSAEEKIKCARIVRQVLKDIIMGEMTSKSIELTDNQNKIMMNHIRRNNNEGRDEHRK